MSDTKPTPQQTEGFHIGKACPVPATCDGEYFDKIIKLWNQMTLGYGQQQSVQAQCYHSGGGIFVIETPLGNGYYLWWGTANENWGADLYDAQGEYIRSVELEIPSTYPDVLRVCCLMYDMICAILDGAVE